MSKPIHRIAGLIGAVVLVAACTPSATTTSGPSFANPTTGSTGVTSGTGGAGGGGVDATESDYKIDVSATSTAAGDVTFHVSNTATQVHEFVVIKTDTAADELPTKDDGLEVDEDASGLTVVDEIEDIEGGDDADLDVTLEAGHYALICNLPGHYQLGMHTDFTVGS